MDDRGERPPRKHNLDGNRTFVAVSVTIGKGPRKKRKKDKEELHNRPWIHLSISKEDQTLHMAYLRFCSSTSRFANSA